MQELFEEYAAYRTKQLIDRKTEEAREEMRKEARIKTQKSAKKCRKKATPSKSSPIFSTNPKRLSKPG